MFFSSFLINSGPVSHDEEYHADSKILTFGPKIFRMSKSIIFNILRGFNIVLCLKKSRSPSIFTHKHLYMLPNWKCGCQNRDEMLAHPWILPSSVQETRNRKHVFVSYEKCFAWLGKWVAKCTCPRWLVTWAISFREPLLLKNYICSVKCWKRAGPKTVCKNNASQKQRTVTVFVCVAWSDWATTKFNPVNLYWNALSACRAQSTQAHFAWPVCKSPPPSVFWHITHVLSYAALNKSKWTVAWQGRLILRKVTFKTFRNELLHTGQPCTAGIQTHLSDSSDLR